MIQRVSLQMFQYSKNTLPEVNRELSITNDSLHFILIIREIRISFAQK